VSEASNSTGLPLPTDPGSTLRGMPGSGGAVGGPAIDTVRALPRTKDPLLAAAAATAFALVLGFGFGQAYGATVGAVVAGSLAAVALLLVLGPGVPRQQLEWDGHDLWLVTGEAREHVATRGEGYVTRCRPEFGPGKDVQRPLAPRQMWMDARGQVTATFAETLWDPAELARLAAQVGAPVTDLGTVAMPELYSVGPALERGTQIPRGVAIGLIALALAGAGAYLYLRFMG